VKAAGVFVGLLTCPPGRHRAFLEWHDGDHRPENVGQIQHMFHSVRWIAPPESLPCREFGQDSPVEDAGEYLLTYWSTAEPERLRSDMLALAGQLRTLGRLDPMGRDFRITWREYLRPARGGAAAAAGVSPDAVPFVPHDGVVITVGRAPDDGGRWNAEYDRVILPGLLASGPVLAALTLHATPAAGPPLFVHLHYTRGNPVEAQPVIQAAVGTRPEIDYRGAYVPQHWSEPQFFQ
jgi:hypothetical protein